MESDRIARVEVIPTRLPFRESFVIGRGKVASAGGSGEHVFVRLETAGGHVGWGEVRALPVWSYETLESITWGIRNYLGPLVLGRSPFEVNALQSAFYERLTPSVSNGQPFAKAAVDIALHDLAGRISGQPVHALLGGKIQEHVALTAALSIDAPDAMAAYASESKDYECFKIKLAGRPEEDAERVRAISRSRPDAVLWLDANQAYVPARLVPFLKAMEDVPRLFCLEQPVKSVDWLGLKQVRQKSWLPVAVDEGCFSSHDVARIAALEAADLLVLKVCKSGGLRQCQSSAAVAGAHGMGLLGSGLTESGVGLVASIHLFSTMEILLPPELNGPQFLESLYVSGLDIQGATVRVPDGPGLGIEVDEEAIRAHAVSV